MGEKPGSGPRAEPPKEPLESVGARSVPSPSALPRELQGASPLGLPRLQLWERVAYCQGREHQELVHLLVLADEPAGARAVPHDERESRQARSYWILLLQRDGVARGVARPKEHRQRAGPRGLRGKKPADRVGTNALGAVAPFAGEEQEV